MTLNTSLLGIIYHSCTSTALYQSAHKIWNTEVHQFKRYDWGKF